MENARNVERLKVNNILFKIRKVRNYGTILAFQNVTNITITLFLFNFRRMLFQFINHKSAKSASKYYIKMATFLDEIANEISHTGRTSYSYKIVYKYRECTIL